MWSPKVFPFVECLPPVGGDADTPWIVYRGDNTPPLQVHPALAKLILRTDGATTTETLSEATGVSASVLETHYRNLVDYGVVEPRGSMKTVGQRHLKVDRIILGFASARLRLVQMDRLLRWVPRVPRVRWVVFATIGLGVVWCSYLALQSDVYTRAIRAEFGLTTIVLLLTLNVLATILHEVGHAACLHLVGGKPGWGGFMLLYGLPAGFCEVSDIWRIHSKADRAAVGLAGIAVNIAIAAIAASGAAIFNNDFLGQMALMNLAVAAFNLFPFMKLDGYIIMSSTTNRPGLREQSMATLRATINRRLDRTCREVGERPTLRRDVVAGLLFYVGPAFVVVMMAYHILTRSFMDTPLFSFVVAVLLLLLLVRIAIIGWGCFRAPEWKSGIPLRGVLFGISVVVAAAVASLPVLPPIANIEYVTQGRDVILKDVSSDEITPGMRIRLFANGLVERSVGTAIVTSAPLPIDTGRSVINAVAVPESNVESSVPSGHAVAASAGRINAVQTIETLVFEPVFRKFDRQ